MKLRNLWQATLNGTFYNFNLQYTCVEIVGVCMFFKLYNCNSVNIFLLFDNTIPRRSEMHTNTGIILLVKYGCHNGQWMET